MSTAPAKSFVRVVILYYTTSTKEKDENLKNALKDLGLIIEKIEELACHHNPGPTASRAVEMIDDTYVLIPREILPEISFGSLDEAIAGDGYARTTNLTEKVADGDVHKMRSMALQYLVMAHYVQEKKQKAEEAELLALRVEAWNILHPMSGMTADLFRWDGASFAEKTAVNAIVDLKRQLAKALNKS